MEQRIENLSGKEGKIRLIDNPDKIIDLTDCFSELAKKLDGKLEMSALSDETREDFYLQELIRSLLAKHEVNKTERFVGIESADIQAGADMQKVHDAYDGAWERLVVLFNK